MTTKAKVTEEGLLIPREVAERTLGKGLKEVEIREEAGRLLILAEPGIPSSQVAEGHSGSRAESDGDPILGLGKNPVRTGARDGSTEHDRYLYGAGG